MREEGRQDGRYKNSSGYEACARFKDGRDAQQQEVNRLDRAAAQRGAAIIIK